MPGLDGFQAAARLRELGRGAEPTILVASAYDLAEARRRVAEAGLAGFLPKPVTASALLDTLMAVLEREGQGQPRRALAEVPAQALYDTVKGRRILLVEDNEFNQQVATELLRGVAGLDVTVAGDGRMALDCLARERFDAVLMDVQMPFMDGLEATRLLRARPGLETLPVIAMTAHAMAQDRDKCLAAGMNDFVSKPFVLEELVRVIARWTSPGAQPAPAAAAATEAFTLELPGILTEVGLKYSVGRPDIYTRMLTRFRDAKAGAAADLRRALDDVDPKAAARIAHTMKSTAMAIGAVPLSDAARNLERALEDGETGAVEGLLATFGERLEQVITGLKAALV
jgi:CheY-like chemotaxis protein/HPt (histidine-containing phosphotransfer) domain-containing protein